MRAIDGDSHFIEPLDLFERYTDPAYRDRTVRVGVDSSGAVIGLRVDNRPMRMADLDDLMSACAGYGQKEEGRSISDFDRYLAEKSGRGLKRCRLIGEGSILGLNWDLVP